MKRMAILAIAVIAALGIVSVVFASVIYSTKMIDFQVQEPVEIAGVLTQLECPAKCIYSPGQLIAEGRYEIENRSGLKYGLVPLVQVDYPGYVPPAFHVLSKIGERIFRPGEVILVQPSSHITVEVTIYIPPDSPAGSAVNPRLEWQRTYKPGCVPPQECG